MAEAGKTTSWTLIAIFIRFPEYLSTLLDRIPVWAALFLALLNGMHERRIWKETLSILCLVGAKMLGLVFCTVLSQAQFQ